VTRGWGVVVIRALTVFGGLFCLVTAVLYGFEGGRGLPFAFGLGALGALAIGYGVRGPRRPCPRCGKHVKLRQRDCPSCGLDLRKIGA
jgi:hypothetical protein